LCSLLFDWIVKTGAKVIKKTCILPGISKNNPRRSFRRPPETAASVAHAISCGYFIIHYSFFIIFAS
jgi:hypothetical protein